MLRVTGAILLLAITAIAQTPPAVRGTRVAPVQVAGPATVAPGLMYCDAQGQCSAVQLGAGLILRVVNGTASLVLASRQVDAFTLAAAAQTVTLTAAPDITREIEVYLNGVLLLPATDYTIAAQTITFTGQSPQTGAIIQVKYWPTA